VVAQTTHPAAAELIVARYERVKKTAQVENPCAAITYIQQEEIRMLISLYAHSGKWFVTYRTTGKTSFFWASDYAARLESSSCDRPKLSPIGKQD